jgi:tRNA(adenine34) deaminase
MDSKTFMELAIAEDRGSKTPYGAVIVKNNQVVARSGNSVKPDHDPTAHAEVNVIRKLTAQLKVPALEPGYTLYTTCEPCAMCAATCVWAGITEIVYGVGADDFENDNPNQIELRCQDVIAKSPGAIAIASGVLKQDCKQLHVDFPL